MVVNPFAASVGVQTASSILAQSINPFSPGYISSTPKQQFQSLSASRSSGTLGGYSNEPPQSLNPFGANYVPSSAQQSFQNLPQNKAVINAIANEAAAKRNLELVRRANAPATILGYGLSHPMESIRGVSASVIAPLFGVQHAEISKAELEARKQYVKTMQELGPARGLYYQTQVGGLEWIALTFPYGKVGASVGGKVTSTAGRQLAKNVVTGTGAGLVAGGTTGMIVTGGKARQSGKAQDVYDFVDSLGITLLGGAIGHAGTSMKVNPPKALKPAEFVAVAGENEPGIKPTLREPKVQPQTVTTPKGEIKSGGDYIATRYNTEPFQTAMSRKEIQNLYLKGETIKETDAIIVKQLGDIQGIFTKQPSGWPTTEANPVNIVGRSRSFKGTFAGFDTGITQYAGIPVETYQPPSSAGFKTTFFKPAEGFKGTPLSKTITGLQQATGQTLKTVVINPTQPGRLSFPFGSALSSLIPNIKNLFKPTPASAKVSPPTTKTHTRLQYNPFRGDQQFYNPFTQQIPKQPQSQSVSQPQSMRPPRQIPREEPRQITSTIPGEVPSSPTVPTSLQVPGTPGMPAIALPGLPWLPGMGGSVENQKYAKRKGRLAYKDELAYARKIMRGLLG